MSVDQYLDRRHNRRHYNCWDFSREVFLDLTGIDIGGRTPDDVSAGSLIQRINEGEKVFTKLDKPESPCLVLLRRPRGIPHIGVYIRGKLLHLIESGAFYQDVADVARTFTSVGYYHGQSNDRS